MAIDGVNALAVRNKAQSNTASGAPMTAREVALGLLALVLRRRRALDEVIEESADLALLSTRDRAFARLLVATVLRRLGQIDDLIARCVSTPLPPRAAPVQDMLRLGVAQLLFLHTPPHAAVATTVDLAQSRGFHTHKGLVNAVLRRLAGDGATWVATQDAARLNTPPWLWDSWCGSYGDRAARAIAEAHLTEAALDISVIGDPALWAHRLEATILPTGTLRRMGGGGIVGMAGFDEGLWWVQDAAAAIPVRLFGPIAGRRIVDLCAAPGGKTAQLAAGGAVVTAIDRSPRRVQRLHANLERLSLKAETVSADAITWRPADAVDGVLLDAPCTATGAIRRHPDVPHLKTPDDVARLAAVQERLLAAAVEMLKPGGLLIYCTCSLEAAEGPDQIDRAIEKGLPVARVPVTADEVGGEAAFITPDGDVRTLPSYWSQYDGIDGFYAARLVRH